MSNLVFIMGESGTGKSTSIKSLDPKETAIFNILGKRLPFKGSNALYNKENKNLFNISDWQTVLNYLDAIDKKAPHIKNIIIDDAIYVMRIEFFDRAKERGYEKFTDMGDHFRKIIAACNNKRDDLNIFMLLHTEPVRDGNLIIKYKASTIGNLLEEKYKPDENTTITLFAQPRFDDKGKAEYGFYTHKLKVDGIEIPAKTPDGMFEEDFIPNDLGLVVKAMNEYYG